MNINATRAAVIAGQIAVIQAHITAWQIYAQRTGENVAAVIAALNAQITALQAL